MSDPTVILVANDVVPGMGLPVAAPGLRAFGLATGLRAHGCEVVTVVDAGPLRALCPAGAPPAVPEGTVVLEGAAIGEFVAGRAPAVVIITNGSQLDRLRLVRGLRLVVDLFAPKMLELACNPGREDRARALEVVHHRKLQALAAADGFIVNGAKKVPYFLAWLLAAGRDPTITPLEVVPLGVPAHFAADRRVAPGCRFVVAGYLQGWSRPGPWLERLVSRLDPPRTTLDLLLPLHWGRRRQEAPPGLLGDLASRPGVTRHDAMPYEAYLDLLGGDGVAVDLFPHTLEREYAMVTRTVVALSCGLPVIHPPFTEVSPLIDRYDAGWLVDPDDLAALDAVVDEVKSFPEAVAARAANARRLWAEVLDPVVATAPLALLVRRLLEG
jgi:hypothetical protein